MSRTTDARFTVEGFHIDGKTSGTLTIEAPKPSGAVLVTARPAYGRAYTLTLPEVFEMICWRVAKKEAK